MSSEYEKRATRSQIEGLRGRLRDRADRLRRLADDIERIAERVDTIGTPDFRGIEIANSASYQVGLVVHEVMGVLPNLNLSNLIESASWIDRELALQQHEESA